MPDFHVNYLAVGAAVLATLTIGAFWYSPLLFGDLWLVSHGYSVDDLQKMAGRILMVSVLCYAVMAYMLAVLISVVGASTALQGALLGILVWFGFMATLGMTTHLLSGNTWMIYIIDTGYQLAYVVLMCVIPARWSQ